MDIRQLSHYRNLKNLSQEEWRSLNIHLFIAANFNRYCSTLLKKIGYQHLPSDASETLLGLYCSVAFKPLASVHARHIDAEGEKRNQVMLGTLKMISMTRMVDAVINEFPAYISLEQIASPTPETGALEFSPNPTGYCRDYQISETDLASAYGCEPGEEIDRARKEAEQHTSAMIETLRHCFTSTQYQIIRYLLCERMDIQQIAGLTDTSLTNIRIMLLNIRRRLFELLSPELAAQLEDCLYRK